MSLLQLTPDVAACRDRHKGAVAWIFGSGPSLDAFLSRRPYVPADDLIFAINECAHILPAHSIRPDYAFAADPIDRYAHAIPSDTMLFLSAVPGLSETKLPLSAHPSYLIPVVGEAQFRGTIILALEIAELMGIREVKLVGFDGGVSRAQQPWISPPSIDRRSYNLFLGLIAEWSARHGDILVSKWAPKGGHFPSAAARQLTLGHFLDRHPGALAFLFGKGSSLDAFLEGDFPCQLARGHQGPVIFGFLSDTLVAAQSILSAAAAHLEDARAAPVAADVTRPSPPLYCFANDSIARWHHIYGDGDILFQPRSTLRDPSMYSPPPACPVVEFEGTGGNPARLGLPRAGLIQHGLLMEHGTCNTAAQILHIMGATKLIAVGCDGQPGRSGRFTFITPVRPDHAQDYAAIRRDFEPVLLGLGLETEFYGEPTILRRRETDAVPGSMRIKRPTVFRGRSIEAGVTIHDATTAEIQTLIGANKAEPVFAAAGGEADDRGETADDSSSPAHSVVRPLSSVL